MSNFFCYICGVQLESTDLSIPVNVAGPLPFGQMHVTVFCHYMCGLNCYLDIKGIENLTDKDRIAIEGKLMEVLTSLSGGTKQ
jgi:hypothetical protein